MWYDDYPERLQREFALMQAAFPQFQLVIDEGSPTGRWVGTLCSNLRGQIYEVHVVYTGSFPFEPPLAFISWPDIPCSPHRYQGDGWEKPLCLFDPRDAARFLEARAIVTKVAEWIFCQEIWEETGGLAAYEQTGSYASTFAYWPSPQIPH